MNDNKNQRGGIGLPIFVIGLIILLGIFYMNTSNVNKDKYYEVINLFKAEQVTDYKLNLSNGNLVYHLAGDEAEKTYRVPDVDIFLADIDEYVDNYNAHHETEMTYDYSTQSSILAIIISLLPTILLLIGLLYLMAMMSQQGKGGVGGVGKARTKANADARKATFADVAGADEEKFELTEVVDYLKNPAQFNALGAKIPKGVLLIGPPGTGKTLLARACAGEAGVPFFSLSGSDFVELYVGVGASRVRDLFDKAKKARPSIIFIDEIDAVGRRRGTGLGGGHDEREQTLNQLLVEMDGFAANEGVIVMAATNRADILDPALLRPGRFDRQIYVGAPDVKGREDILKVHSKNKPLAPDVDLKVIAKTSVGFTGADLENLMNEAALLAARNKRKAITKKDIEEATIKVMAGPEKKSRKVTENEKKLTAYHEAGHALAFYYKTPDTPVHQVSIVPRGSAGGYTMPLPSDETNYATKKKMFANIVTLLGGRIAEQLVLDDISTGASNDLQRATETARSMVTKYGFSEKLGPVVYDSHDEVFIGRDLAQSKPYSEEVAGQIDEEVRRIIEEAYEECTKLLSEHMDKLHGVAQGLIRYEKLDGDEFKTFMDGDKPELLLGDDAKEAEAIPEHIEETEPAAVESEVTAETEEPVSEQNEETAE